MIIVTATLRNLEDEHMSMQVHHVLNEQKITSLPLNEEEEAEVIMAIEKDYPDYIVESLDSVTWTS